MKRLLVPLFALGVLLSACQPTAMDDGTGPIKIGFIGPLTGEAAAYGVDPLAGIQIHVDEINAAGGINGRMIELVAEDGKCTGADAASAAQKLINVDKVDAILGGQCSGETLAAAPIAESAGVILLSAISSSPDVTEAGDYVFRDYPSDALKTKAMASYFAQQGWEKVAIITENTDFAQGFRTSLMADVGEDAFVFDETVDPNTKDFRTLATRLQDEEFDVFVSNAQFPATVAAQLQQMRELGIEQTAISHDVADTLETIELTGDAAEGFQVINVQSISAESPFGVKVADAGKDVQAGLVYVAHGYDALGVLAEAMESVGTESDAIRDYFYDLAGYDGVIGTFSFDDNGDVEGINYALKEVQNGEFVKVQDVVVE